MTTIYASEGGKNPAPLDALYVDLQTGVITIMRNGQVINAGGGSDSDTTYTLPAATIAALGGMLADADPGEALPVALTVAGLARVVSVTGQDYALDGTEGLILVTTVGRTITLPNATTVRAGKGFYVKNADGGSSTVVNTAGGNIDTIGSFALSAPFAGALFISDNTSYWIL